MFNSTLHLSTTPTTTPTCPICCVWVLGFLCLSKKRYLFSLKDCFVVSFMGACPLLPFRPKSLPWSVRLDLKRVHTASAAQDKQKATLLLLQFLGNKHYRESLIINATNYISGIYKTYH